MQPSDMQRFSALLAEVMAYYRNDVSDFTNEVFWNACQGFDFEQVAKAFEAHARDPEHGRFAPKVADLVRVLQGTRVDRAAIAWGRALKAASSVGAYTDVIFDDPAIHAAIEDLGGWPKLCRCEFEELGYLQHRFGESYRAYVGRGTFEYPARLIGARESDELYLKRGLPAPKARLIGEREACIRVAQGGDAARARIASTTAALLEGVGKEAA